METKFIVDYNDGASLEIVGDDNFEYKVQFFDFKNGELVHEDTIRCNHWAKTNRKYFTQWKIFVYKDNVEVFSDTFDCYDKNVIINSTSTALGDNIAFIPYFEEFRKKHHCNVLGRSKFYYLFQDLYPDIEMIDLDAFSKKFSNPYATYYIYYGIDSNIHREGVEKLQRFYDNHSSIKYIKDLTFHDKNRHPEHPHYIPVQKIASNVLGLEYKEIRPIFNIECEPPSENEYICISEFASARGMKEWNNQIGWQMLVNELDNRGYDVISISKEKSNLKNVIKRNGNYSLTDRMQYLKHAEFFISVPSGLAWLNWAVGKKTVMIGGLSEDWCEFQEDNIRVKNPLSCTGCYNSKEHADKLCCFHCTFCPTDKNFECSRKISPKMVMDKIIENKLIK